VDFAGHTLDFLLSAKRDTQSAKRFFHKALKAKHTQTPRVINVDKNPAYPPAVEELNAEDHLPTRTKLRAVK
jgi:transposase-like protein